MCGGGGCCVWYGRRGAVSPPQGWLLWSCCPPDRWLLSLLWGLLSGVLALAVGVAARLRWRWRLLQGVVVVLGLPVLVVVAGFVALGWLLCCCWWGASPWVACCGGSRRWRLRRSAQSTSFSAWWSQGACFAVCAPPSVYGAGHGPSAIF